MPYSSLEELVAHLEGLGELKRIRYPADPHLEISEITDRVVKSGGPALLFERPKGYEVPLLTNAALSQLFNSDCRQLQRPRF